MWRWVLPKSWVRPKTDALRNMPGGLAASLIASVSPRSCELRAGSPGRERRQLAASFSAPSLRIPRRSIGCRGHNGCRSKSAPGSPRKGTNGAKIPTAWHGRGLYFAPARGQNLAARHAFGCGAPTVFRLGGGLRGVFAPVPPFYLLGVGTSAVPPPSALLPAPTRLPLDSAPAHHPRPGEGD